MQFDWKSYFIFTSKEQKGILVLGCILTLSLLLHYLLTATSTNNTAFSNNKNKNNNLKTINSRPYKRVAAVCTRLAQIRRL